MCIFLRKCCTRDSTAFYDVGAQKVSIAMCQGVVNLAIAGTSFHNKLKHGVTRKWVTRFAKRSDLVVKSGRACENRRALWGKSSNLLKHYLLVADQLVSMGAAVKNPDYDEYKPYDEPIFVLEPWR
jgi:hypothetical protein